MLSSAETIDVIAETLQAHKVPAIVLDPVNKTNADYLILPMLISV
jgi:hydroxymethylpyrimidine/phosphomethylpyrimidine kinase